MAETGSLINKRSPRPDILQKNPQNLYLLAEARCGQTALNDAIFEVKQALSSLRRAHRNSWPNGMVQDFIVRLSNKLDASEDTLSRCQSKLNALVSIHPAFCSDIHQLRENLSTYNKKFIKMRRECKRFLPDTSLNSPTVSTFHHKEDLNLPIFEAVSQAHGQDGATTAEHETEVQEEPDDVQDPEMLSNPQVQGEPDDAQGQHLERQEQEAHTSAQRPVSDDTEAFNSSLIFGVDSKELGQVGDTTAGHAHKLD